MYLPRPEPPAGEEAEAPVSAEAGTSDESMLVVEDDPGVRDYLVETLTDLRYRVIEASNGELAVNMLDRKQFRAISC